MTEDFRILTAESQIEFLIEGHLQRYWALDGPRPPDAYSGGVFVPTWYCQHCGLGSTLHRAHKEHEGLCSPIRGSPCKSEIAIAHWLPKDVVPCCA